MIVHFVRKHYAQPGVTVTESKFLHDSHVGIHREVDVVIEGNFDGEAMFRDGSQLLAVVYFEEKIYGADGTELGSVDDLTQETLNIGWLRRNFSEEAHSHPQRDDLKSFTCAVSIDSLGYHLRNHDTGELCLISMIELLGEFSFAQQEIAFTIADMADRRYGFTEASILGRPAIWVATTHPETEMTTVSWRTKDDKPLIERRTSARVLRFPGLATLEPQPDQSIVPLTDAGGRETVDVD
jgi:hypothetical protein